MTHHPLLRASLLGAALLSSLPTFAQGLRPSMQLNSARIGQSLTPVAKPTVQQADYIVAIVNSEPITNNEVRQRMAVLAQQLAQRGQTNVSREELARETVERLVQERAQLQVAKETGVKVDEPALDNAEQGIARRNQVDVTEFRQRLRAEGLSVERFRDELRQQITLSRVREREVEGKVRVSDQDADLFLIEQQNNVDPSKLMLNLAQILIQVPETATAPQISALEARARRVLDRARLGDDFVALVQQYSDVPEKTAGGMMGLRPAERYPELFVQATQDVSVGGVAAIVRSSAGFHVLKVIEKAQADMPGTTVTQNRVRHILLRTGQKLSEGQAVEKLTEFRREIQSGKADFAVLAKAHSEDGSAANGGDLDWANPGLFVPEFEEAVTALSPGEIGQPLVSRFGVHLIQLMDRREGKLTALEQRELARSVLREKRLEEAYANWAQEIRGRAYVELRDPPE
jgi:peptidyl-prolyl cis-trans isomerase SurA